MNRIEWMSAEGRTVVAYEHDSGQTWIVEHMTTSGQPALERPLVFETEGAARAAARFIAESILTEEALDASAEEPAADRFRRPNRAADPSRYGFLVKDVRS